ncbi:hypothetical protein [Actinomadura nitritigenes]|uniref:hypothetical protein n=1 Tax=Actinomadura nitritigenes TaxID=134602 RepID=UPI003D947024
MTARQRTRPGTPPASADTAASWAFVPVTTGLPAIDLHHGHRRIRRLLDLNDRAALPRLVQMLEDARQRGRAHGWCNQRAEFGARLEGRSDGHTHYRTASGNRVIREHDGQIADLFRGDVPKGLWPTQMVNALQSAYMLGQEEAGTR